MLQRWIFKGVCDDKYKEFFILSDDTKVPVLDKMAWNRMYQLNKALVPSFLKGLEKELLECGKSMALLKMCAPEVSDVKSLLIYIKSWMNEAKRCYVL